MAEQPAIVKTIGLTKVFKDFWRRDKVVAVRNLDLEIRQGEVFGLLGPNGSGKSTTIKMMLGLLYPTRGRISIFGRSPTDVSIKNRIGYLPEESYLYRFLDARETLQLYARLFQQVKEVRGNRIDKLLEMVGLQHQAKRRIGEYSKGMARRIGLAQALINDPDFLILDEPTTGMDPIGTAQIKELIRELARRGKTILLSSHLLSDVQDVCDRLSILYGGQSQAEGDVDGLLKQTETTQIETGRLNSDTVDEIRRVIQQREGNVQVSVSSPTEKLENFFVRIVEEARASSVTTSGVGSAGEMPDFLAADDQGDHLIESLVAASSPTEPDPVDSPSTGVDDSAAQETEEDVVVNTLVQQAEAAEESTPEPESQAAEPQDDVDHGVIDSLLGSAEENRGG